MDVQAPSYAETLRDAITKEKTSRTKLSFALAAETGNTQKSEYRALGKYLRGDEAPSPERAAVLAVLLREPRLALVTAVAERRRGRQAELEARVADLEALSNTVMPQLEELASRVIALEQRPSTKQRKDGTGP